MHVRSNPWTLGAGLCLLFVLGLSAARAAEKKASAGASSNVLSACSVPGVAQTVRCGVVNVPENPNKPRGRQIPISIVVVPAETSPARPDPIVLLMGGPGEDAISSAEYFVGQLALALRERDLVLIDQRGTGRSATLRCNLYSPDDPAVSLRDVFPPAAVKRCLEQASARADLTQYSYLNFASDLEHIRRTLGYGPLNLSAGSYGTRAAQVYMRAYPKSVRTAYLGSIVPIDVPMPLPFAKSTDAALENLLSLCAADASCQAAFPNLRNEFREILARLESGSVRTSVPGLVDVAPLSKGRVVEWFRSKLYRPSSAADLPWLIHEAYLGNWSPIAEGILSGARVGDTERSFGAFFSITCNEDVAFISEEDIVQATQGTILGDFRLRQQKAACKDWPKYSVPKDYRTQVQSAVPTMFVSGDADAGTPLSLTEHAAKGFSKRLNVIERGQGHTEWNDCVARLYEQFVRTGTVEGSEPDACPVIPRPAFKTQGSAPSTASIQQLRIYEIFENNKQAFHDRFRDHAMRIMKKYDFKILSMWETRFNGKTQFVYLLEWPDEQTLKDRWARLLADAEWIDIKKRTAAAHGRLVGDIEDRILRRTSYSP